MLFGLGIGLAVALVVYLRNAPSPVGPRIGEAVTQSLPAEHEEPAATAPSHQTLESAGDGSDAANEARTSDDDAFSFFNDLSKSEVVVDENEFDFGSGSDAPRVVFIQAGAFLELDEADARQATLALLGYESHIDTAIVGGKLWFRVLIGPLTERADINRAVRRLRSEGIETALRPVSN